MAELFPEQTLDALAFVTGVIDQQPADWGYILDTIDAEDLIVGLTVLAKSLLIALARATDRSVSATVEMERAVHLFTAAGGAA